MRKVAFYDVSGVLLDFLYVQCLVAVIYNGRTVGDEDYRLVAFLKYVL